MEIRSMNGVPSRVRCRAALVGALLAWAGIQGEEPAVRVQYSNNRHLVVQYKVRDSMTEDNVLQSRLYYTLNSGISWRFYGLDPDGRSPMEFLADNDGLYGFKVGSVDRAGHEESAPTAGTPPDILVLVDTAAPRVRLLSPAAGELWEAGTRRLLRWEAEDEALEEGNCVTLYSSAGSEGNWHEIASGLPARGQFAWTVPDSESGEVFLKVRVMDLARNAATSEGGRSFFTRNVMEDRLSREVRDQANRYYEAATIARKNGDTGKAVKYYRLCLELNPYLVGAHNDLALALLDAGEPEEAFEHFELGLKYAPSREPLLANLAELYLSYGQTAMARKVLLRLLQVNPKSPEGLWLAAREAEASGDPERARIYLKRLTNLDFPEGSAGQRMAAGALEALARVEAQSSGVHALAIPQARR